MINKYYFDTCIWIDYFEGRKDNIRPLGDWAFDLIKKIIREEAILVYSDLVEEELSEKYTREQIKEIFSIIPTQILLKLSTSKAQLLEAIKTARALNIPVKDALHAIIARDNASLLVTRDKHFQELSKLVEIKKPEELI